MTTGEFARDRFTPLGGRLESLCALILEHAPRDRPLRFLDLGCGCGDLVFRLAEALPLAHLTGMDISAPSITRAEETRLRSPHRERLSFQLADYMTFRAAPFDIIFAWSVLQWIAASDEELLTKIGTDLNLHGTFINGMPYECPYNQGLTLLRRMFRACRTRSTDRLFFLGARLFHGAAYGEDALRERVAYMYHLPRRLDGPHFRTRIAALGGLESVAEYKEPLVSAAQLRSRLVVFRKGALPARRAA